jgi:hypothetical protein
MKNKSKVALMEFLFNATSKEAKTIKELSQIIGLTEQEIRSFVATIVASSKKMVVVPVIYEPDQPVMYKFSKKAKEISILVETLIEFHTKKSLDEDADCEEFYKQLANNYINLKKIRKI